MASENLASGNDQIKALEEQLAQMRKLQEQTEAQLADLARQQALADEQSATVEVAPEPEVDPDEFDLAPEIDVRVVEKDDPSDPPKLDAPGQRVLGAIKRKIEKVSNRGDEAADDASGPADEPEARGDISGVSDAAIAGLAQKLDALSEQILSAPHEAQAVTQDALQQVLNEIVTAVGSQAQSAEQYAQTIRADLKTIHSQAGQLAQQIAQISAALSKKEEEAASDAAAPAGLEQAICGESLAANQGIVPARQELISEFLAGDPGAMGLAGQLLLFQAAPADRMPHLLKDVGEAYYRWRPQAAHAADPFQHAMIAWLMQACEQSGSANRIELVRPGDRYDAARHHAKSRGLEITEVFGWVVLRDNGKVYTKAAVAVA